MLKQSLCNVIESSLGCCLQSIPKIAANGIRISLMCEKDSNDFDRALARTRAQETTSNSSLYGVDVRTSLEVYVRTVLD
jgi:hypothetical protein